MLRVGRPTYRPIESQRTPMQKTSEVVFELSSQSQQAKNWVPFRDVRFCVTLSEPVSFEIATKWKESGGASIANKLNDIFNSNLIKMIGGANAVAGTPTDAWSQKITEIGDPIGMKLKFRIYHKNAQEHNSYAEAGAGEVDYTYTDLIKFFTIVCAPPQIYTLKNDTIGPLVAAAQTANKVMTKSREVYDSRRAAGQGVVSSSIDAGLGLIKTAAAQGGLDGVTSGPRLNYTLLFTRVGTFNFPREIDWIVKSFTWTPSTQMIVGETDCPEPLWVDFDVDVETNFAPSNAFVTRMFTPLKHAATD